MKNLLGFVAVLLWLYQLYDKMYAPEATEETRKALVKKLAKKAIQDKVAKM
jgi:hypothetical protein